MDLFTRLGIFALVIIITGCSHGTVDSFSSQDAVRELSLQLKSRNIDNAYKYYAFLKSKNVFIPDLFAQYSIMTCRYRDAFDAIQKIKDEKQKTTFLAILFALQASEIPTVQSTKIESSDTELRRVRVDSNEIWPDEWSTLNKETHYCKGQSLVQSEVRKQFYRLKSLELFEKLSPQDLVQDENILALALEVGSNPMKFYSELIKMSDKNKQSYYRSKIISHINNNKLNVKDDFKLEYLDSKNIYEREFDVVTVKVEREQKQSIEIPILIGDAI